MIKILHFSHSMRSEDGIDAALKRLDPSRFKLSALIVSPSNSPIKTQYTADFSYPIDTLNIPLAWENYPQILRLLVAKIRQFKPHILHAHHYHENLIASVAVRLTPVPCYVIGRHYADLIYHLSHGVKQNILIKAEGFCNYTATQIVVPTQQVAQLLTERQGVPPEKITIIPYGFNFSSYVPSSPDSPKRLRQEYELQDKYMILACCRLNREKGLEYLFEAISQIKRKSRNFKLVIVGSGTHQEELHQQCKNLGINNFVTFVGWRTDVLDWIAAADLVVQPSLSESFCQVLIEALAFYKPVIMTPVGVAPEVIGKNERGRLVPISNSEAITEFICELMSDRELGEKLGKLGNQYVRQNMGADVAARRYENLYNSLIEKTL
ncbi:glycosyltransferase family 4 protein [Laspinema olomoucense]|uniref:Glycosyltransferase family 4 protein n=1 Tax=Laspinema olomoucense D3b TaxID=2953688 RepID=A0ABT2N537_9CYAN|nr:glycosyltransferase family 4 protein [Laspinema sp. D3b]MCT7976490.1 glycosyltransferase family 4 protein [Laspinema sp. D3b]